MSRILVTGGAGFIGSHLVDALLAAGHEVTVLDNLFTGRKKNYARHLGNARFEFIRHDVTEPILLETERVYHLACPASPVHYQYNPVKTIKTNVMGTIHMLGLCKRLKSRLLLASTSEVYGDPLEHPQKETYWGNVNPVGLRSCYDEGKRVAETLAFSYHQQNGVDAVVVRIFYTFGPRMLFNDGRVVSNFIVQALRSENLTVYGKGEQTRSFCYVDDMIRGLVAAMNKSGFHGPVNLGNPVETSIGELARLIIELSGSKSKIVNRPLPPDDPSRRRPDITLASKELDWRPAVELRTGLEKTIGDFDQRLREGEKVDE